jgi:hypothetical protein
MNFRVTVTEPGSTPVTLDRDVFGAFTAETAGEYAQRCAETRPAGTTIRIQERDGLGDDWHHHAAFVVGEHRVLAVEDAHQRHHRALEAFRVASAAEQAELDRLRTLGLSKTEILACMAQGLEQGVAPWATFAAACAEEAAASLVIRES